MGTTWEWVAGDEALAPLWAAVHDRLCAGTDPAAVASVRVTGLPPAGVAALRAWLDDAGRLHSLCTARDGSGRPGERIGARIARSAAHCRRAPAGACGIGFLGRPIQHLRDQGVATTS